MSNSRIDSKYHHLHTVRNVIFNLCLLEKCVFSYPIKWYYSRSHSFICISDGWRGLNIDILPLMHWCSGISNIISNYIYIYIYYGGTPFQCQSLNTIKAGSIYVCLSHSNKNIFLFVNCYLFGKFWQNIIKI